MKNKPRVLFIGYEYYEYHKLILKGLRKYALSIDYFPVMNYSLRYTIYRRLSHKLFLTLSEKHGQQILKRTEGKDYDVVFVIQGQQLSRNFFNTLKQRYVDAYWVNYHWDAVRKTEYGNTLLDNIPYFDKIYSFDLSDAKKHKNLTYLPLFSSLPDVSRKYTHNGILFVGSLTNIMRYRSIIAFKKYAKSSNLKFEFFFVMDVRDFFKFLMRGILVRNVRFKKFSSYDISSLYQDYKIILDVPNQIQSGFTMRVIEVLSSGRKLVTTNDRIVETDLYKASNVAVINIDDIDIDAEFLSGEFQDMDMTEYSLDNWIKTILRIERP